MRCYTTDRWKKITGKNDQWLEDLLGQARASKFLEDIGSIKISQAARNSRKLTRATTIGRTTTSGWLTRG